MDRRALERLLRSVRSGAVDLREAVERIRTLPMEEMGFATLDLHRAIRKGFPEVVYGAGKTPEQILTILESLIGHGQTGLVTRVSDEAIARVERRFPEATVNRAARAVAVRRGRRPRPRPGVVVLSAGTSDIPVAEEAAFTAEIMGEGVTRVFDVGVAGLHRLLAHKTTLANARVIVVVAGMEGALPSVVAGLVDCPVIAVPTSTGYGAGAGGFAALFAMLNSCASGVSVVNIDNGFGAGYAASLMNRPRRRR